MKNRLIAITIVKNEENNYLRSWLKSIGKIADYHIFLDDASDDNTPNIIEEHLKKYSGKLYRSKKSIFLENEPKLRSRLWRYVRSEAHEGDWILIVDADEFYDRHILQLKPKLLNNKFPDIEVVKVSCLDMWDAHAYRTDGHWSPYATDTRLIRFHNVPFGEKNKFLHQPPYPASTDLSKNLDIWIPKIHFAYLRAKDKKRRYDFYTSHVSPKQNPVGYKHALSIMDKNIETKKYFNLYHTILAGLHRDVLYFIAKSTAATENDEI